MTALRDCALSIADAASRRLEPDYPFRIAFADDDSDYIPAALDMMTELMRALADDYSSDECDKLIERIRNDDMMLTDDNTRYSDLPLDIALDLPFHDPYA